MPARDWIETATEQIAGEALRAVIDPMSVDDGDILDAIRAIEPTVRRVADEAAREATERDELAAAQAEAARLRLAFSNLLSEHTQSDDDPQFWIIHESDLGAAQRALTTFEHTETAAARGAAMLRAVRLLRDLDAALMRGDQHSALFALFAPERRAIAEVLAALKGASTPAQRDDTATIADTIADIASSFAVALIVRDRQRRKPDA
jgi:hypothetical protein